MTPRRGPARGRLLAAAVVAAVALRAPEAAAWRATWRGWPQAVAVGPGDAIVVAGTRAGRFAIPGYDVVLRSSGGRVRWRFKEAFGHPQAVTFDAAGDVVVAGTIAEAGIDAFAVIGLDGARGTERWRFLLPNGSATRVVAAPGGGTIVAGDTADGVVLARLDPAGNPLWVQATMDRAEPSALTVDDAGRATVVGEKVASVDVDGTPRWNGDFGLVRGVAATADGDVVVGTGEGALRLDGYGIVRWRAMLGEGRVDDVALDGAGDVVLGATVGTDRVVVKLDGVSGAERWRWTAGGPNDEFAGVDVVTDAEGNVAAGTTLGPEQAGRIVVFYLTGTGAVRGRVLVASARSGRTTVGGVVLAVDSHGRAVALAGIGSLKFNNATVRGVLLVRGPPR